MHRATLAKFANPENQKTKYMGTSRKRLVHRANGRGAGLGKGDTDGRKPDGFGKNRLVGHQNGHLKQRQPNRRQLRDGGRNLTDRAIHPSVILRVDVGFAGSGMAGFPLVPMLQSNNMVQAEQQPIHPIDAR